MNDIQGVTETPSALSVMDGVWFKPGLNSGCLL